MHEILGSVDPISRTLSVHFPSLVTLSQPPLLWVVVRITVTPIVDSYNKRAVRGWRNDDSIDQREVNQLTTQSNTTVSKNNPPKEYVFIPPLCSSVWSCCFICPLLGEETRSGRDTAVLGGSVIESESIANKIAIKFYYSTWLVEF